MPILEPNTLSPGEIELINAHRERLRAERERLAFRQRALETALAYERWLQQHERGHTHSAFVDEFGYQQDDAQAMSRAVGRILSAVEPRRRAKDATLDDEDDLPL